MTNTPNEKLREEIEKVAYDSYLGALRSNGHNVTNIAATMFVDHLILLVAFYTQQAVDKAVIEARIDELTRLSWTNNQIHERLAQLKKEVEDE